MIRNMLSSDFQSPSLEKKNPPVAGRLAFFQKAWDQLTQDPHLLNIVKGYKIRFLKEPKQKKITSANPNDRKTERSGRNQR